MNWSNPILDFFIAKLPMRVRLLSLLIGLILAGLLVLSSIMKNGEFDADGTATAYYANMATRTAAVTVWCEQNVIHECSSEDCDMPTPSIDECVSLYQAELARQATLTRQAFEPVRATVTPP